MSKDKISDYDSTAANNTDVGGINIQGGAPPSNFDNALREFASHLADMNAGTSPIDDTFTLADPTDTTKKFRFDAAGITTGTTRVITIPDSDFTMFDGSTLVDTVTFGDPTDATKKFRFDAVGITTGTTRVITVPDKDFTLIDGTALEDTVLFNDPDDATKKFRFDGGNITTATTRTITIPDGDITLGGGGGVPTVVIEDQKSSGTASGAFTAGAWQTRDLNTYAYGVSGDLALSSNEFTPVADGWVEGEGFAFYVGVHQTRLYNVTDSAVVSYGTNAYARNGTYYSSTSSNVCGAVVAGKTYRLEHRCGATRASDGFGPSMGFGSAEIFARIKYWKG